MKIKFEKYESGGNDFVLIDDRNNLYDLNSDKIKICLPLQNDFGDMSSEDFSSWEEKFEKSKFMDQSKNISELIDKLTKTKYLSKNLLKNRKYINEC